MRPRVVAWSHLLAFAFAEATVPNAIGAARSEAIRISVGGDAGCAAESDIVNLLARGGQARRAEGDEPSRRFDVVFEKTADGVLGRLDVTDLEGSTSQRTFPAETCEEALHAVALVIALTLTPEPSSHEIGARAQSTTVATSGRSLPVSAPLSEPSALVSALSWKPELAVRADASVGVGPAPMAGVLGLVRLYAEEAASGRSTHLPSLAAGVRRSFLNTSDVGLKGSQVGIGASLLVGRIELCSLLVSKGRFELDPCVVGEIGEIEAVARSETLVPSSTKRRELWGGLGLLALARIRMGWGLSAQAGVGGLIPFSRYHFDFRETQEVSPNWLCPFETAPVTGAMDLGIAWTLR